VREDVGLFNGILGLFFVKETYIMNTVARNQKIRCLCVRERESERDVKRDQCKKRPISHVKRDLYHV